MTPRIKFLVKSGIAFLALGFIIGVLPTAFLGKRHVPECGSAWFRGLPVDVCANALATPTIFSAFLAVSGLVMLLAGMATKYTNETAAL